MEFAVVPISVVPVRAEPSDRSEMVTQLLFGDLVVIERRGEGWAMIRNVYDNYEGWVDEKQIQTIGEEEFSRLNTLSPCYVTDLVEVVQDLDTYQTIPVLIGSVIRNLGEDNVFEMAGRKYEYTGQYACGTGEVPAQDVLEHAMMFLNSPYQWGGRSPFGVDCSGFVQVVFMLSGIHLLRDSSEQAGMGEHIRFLDEAHAGDLVFFDNSEGEIIHVGILLPNKEIIHASGKVRIDRIDTQGIFNESLKKYTHSLRFIRRIL
jgi:hypothetical protein